jgi:hypothetical protein
MAEKAGCQIALAEVWRFGSEDHEVNVLGW